jgi:hypothetical protein
MLEYMLVMFCRVVNQNGRRIDAYPILPPQLSRSPYPER